MPKMFVTRSCVFVAILSCAVAVFAETADEQFERLGTRYLDAFPAFSPVSATWLGDHRFDSELDEVSPEAREKQLAFIQKTLKELDAIPRDKLSVANQIDAAMLRHQLEASVFYLTELKNWESDPILYSNLVGGAIYNLMARDFAPLADRLRSATARLEKLPRLYQQIRSTLVPERVSPVQAEAVVKQNRGVISIIENQIKPHIASLASDDRERLNRAIETATKAVEEHQTWLEEVLTPRAKADFRLGPELYDKKLFYSLGTPMSRDEINELATKRLVETRDEMFTVASEIYKREYPATCFPADPTPEYKQAIIRAALEVVYRNIPPRDGVVDAAKKSLAEATEFVRKHELVTIPPDPVEIILMPEFQRGVSVAYCDSPGALDVGQKTFYAVSPIPDDWTDAQVASFLREYNLRSIDDLTIHEAMPGHYLQLAHANRYNGKLRQVLASETFIEGWAIYSERLMADAGFRSDDDLAMRLINRKWELRAITNALIDQGIHAGSMTRDEAMALMMEVGFQEEREAAMKWTRALLTSTQLSTYFVGTMEMFAIRRDVEAKRGKDFRLKEYHDELLSFGSPFPRFARVMMLGEKIR
ncbi:MAG: DUF885 domain-containing protein [Thermoguttaceae bacterium]